MGTREQEFKLKDGRTIFKTHNGFKYFAEDKKGEVLEVEEKYWKQAWQNRIK
jgi:hypothetical protein